MLLHYPMKSKWSPLLTALLFVFLSLLTIVQSQPRRLSSADILPGATVSDAQISPSGEWIVYSVSTAEGDQTVSTLWILTDGERLSTVPPTSRQPDQRPNCETLRYAGGPRLPPA